MDLFTNLDFLARYVMEKAVDDDATDDDWMKTTAPPDILSACLILADVAP